jgi:fatty acid synthase subunit beta
MECFGHAKAKQQPEGYIKLEHGFATIPLPGINVPFHSAHVNYFHFD